METVFIIKWSFATSRRIWICIPQNMDMLCWYLLWFWFYHDAPHINGIFTALFTFASMASRINLWLSGVSKVIPKNKGKLQHYINTAKKNKRNREHTIVIDVSSVKKSVFWASYPGDTRCHWKLFGLLSRVRDFWFGFDGICALLFWWEFFFLLRF